MKKKMIDENELARIVAKKEGKEEELSIAQIKEVIKITLDELMERPPSQVMLLLEKHTEKVFKKEIKTINKLFKELKKCQKKEKKE